MRRGTKTTVAKEICRTRKAGTWALPKMYDASRLVKFVKRMEKGEWPVPMNDIGDLLYPILGDDALFDQIDRAERMYLKTSANAIRARIRELAEQAAKHPEEFTDPEDGKVLQLIWDKIH